MTSSNCVSCKTIRGDIYPPGGILYENRAWLMFLRSCPPLVAGQGFIILKRHCETITELTPLEQELLGVTMVKTAQAMGAVLKPEKVHFGLYAESVKHIHLHVTPRLSTLPAGNIPLMWLTTWWSVLTHLKLRRPISDTAVALVAEQLQVAFEQNL
jgi:diadenosine tetraphosphate (Ap4A) HIT family hydrolase